VYKGHRVSQEYRDLMAIRGHRDQPESREYKAQQECKDLMAIRGHRDQPESRESREQLVSRGHKGYKD